MKIIHAIYENGIFRPIDPVDLPDRCEVVFEPKVLTAETSDERGLDRIYAILSERYDSGRPDISERHDEHQP